MAMVKYARVQYILILSVPHPVHLHLNQLKKLTSQLIWIHE